jgi:hypothetical protein
MLEITERINDVKLTDFKWTRSTDELVGTVIVTTENWQLRAPLDEITRWGLLEANYVPQYPGIWMNKVCVGQRVTFRFLPDASVRGKSARTGRIVGISGLWWKHLK